MSVKSLLIASLLCGCNVATTNKKIAISKNVCKPDPIETQFVPVIDEASMVKNQRLASLYFYQQREQIDNTVECYEAVINELQQ